MPGRTKDEARENFANPIRQTLSCVTTAPAEYSFSRGYETLTLRGGIPVALQATDCVPVSLGMVHLFTVEEQNMGEWKVRTQGYAYHVHNQHGQLMFCYHWHPWRSQRYPHLHIKYGSGVLRPDVQRAHFPTGRVAIETVILFLVAGFHVSPVRGDWQGIAESNLERFENWRTWV